MRAKAKRKPQPFDLENFSEIPEYRKKMHAHRKKRIEMSKKIEKNYDEIQSYFTSVDKNSQLEHIDRNSKEADDIIDGRLQYLPCYDYTDEIGWVGIEWVIDREEGWIYQINDDLQDGDLKRIPYNEKLADLLEKSNDLSQQIAK